MTERTHRVRNALTSGERTFTLTDDALCWTEVGRPKGRLAYADIRAIQLISYASPIGTALQCTLRSKAGGKVKLRSAHYRGLGDFEDRTKTYAPLVQALAGRIDAANPDATFIAGSTGLWILWLVVGLIWVGVIAFLSLALFATSLLGTLAVALGFGAICLPLIWHEVAGGGAKTFDPHAPPGALLGDT